MRPPHLLIAAFHWLATLATLLADEKASSTLLIDFGPDSTSDAAPKAFWFRDKAVDLEAPVFAPGPGPFGKGSPANPVPVGSGFLKNVEIEEKVTGRSFATKRETAAFLEHPVLSDYRYRKAGQKGELRISRLHRVPKDTPIVLTLWGVGDKVGANTLFTVSYGEEKHTAITNGGTGLLRDAVAQFIFKKQPEINEIKVTYEVPPGQTEPAALCGLSLTVTPL